MKRIFLVFLLILTVLTPSFADDFGSFAITGGYTSKDNTGFLGFNGSYQYTAPVSEYVSIGFGSHADFAFGLNHKNNLTLFFGTMLGLGLEADFTDRLSMNISLGPAMVVDIGVSTSSIGIGLGADASVSYYFDEYKSVGFNGGVTIYPQFLVLDDGRDTAFSIGAVGYIGLAFRFPSPVAAIAIPIIDAILY